MIPTDTTTTTTNPSTTAPRSRRDVLCGLLVALVAPGVVVSACGDSGSTGSGTTPTGGGGATPTGGGTPGTTGGGAPAGGQVLAKVADVPEGGGLIVDNPKGGKILLVRPAAAEVKGFNPACPHQGTLVDPPQGGTITCPNHGSTFDGSTGARTGGPATKGLATVAVKIDGTGIVLA